MCVYNFFFGFIYGLFCSGLISLELNLVDSESMVKYGANGHAFYEIIFFMRDR